MSFAESWKALGNKAFQEGDFATAITHFTKAIELEPNSAVYHINRSLTHAALVDWTSSLNDAQIGVTLDPKYVKGHFRKVKALIALKKLGEARLSLNFAIKSCGENKDLRVLEEEIYDLTGTPLRPKSSDFEIICELGDGNFSKVYKTYLKKNKKVFAVKTIEKQTIERMKRRHPNINNEILMEKRALQKISHPGIITLFSTFQDYGTLYYQMEYVGGWDLWTALHEIIPDATIAQPEKEDDHVTILDEHGDDQNVPKTRGRTGAQLGVHWSQLRFYFAEILSALEHMHRRGIVHRDIKPENIMISDKGHIKFIDFGTAKDLVQRDLNGQEFVGTPEYMSPGTVGVKSGVSQRNMDTDAAVTFSSVEETCEEQNPTIDSAAELGKEGVGLEADLWAVGVMLFQMVLGYTPFNAPSPYLVFLRIKRDLLKIPGWVPSPIAGLIHVFLEKDANRRMQLCFGRAIDSTVSDPAVFASLSYDKLREHSFFSQWDAEINFPRRAFYGAKLRELENISSTEYVENEESVQLPSDERFTNLAAIRAVYADETVCRVPSLHDLCVRAVADAAVKVAFASAHNGGLRPKIPWMQRFQLHKTLSPCDRSRVMHVLERKEKLHVPSVHRLFFSSLPDSRCLRASVDTRDVVGLSRSLQGQCTADFHFASVANPSLGESAEGENEEENRFRQSVSSVNKLRPKFLTVLGSFTQADVLNDREIFLSLADRFRKIVARVSDTIPVQFVPGPREVGLPATPESLAVYRRLFGADFYGFWFQGMRGIVLNSSLLIDGSAAPTDSELQELWLEEEIEQAKLCASTVVLFSFHPWYHHDIDEEDVDETNVCVRTIPKAIRKHWINKLQHHKVKLVFSTGDPSLGNSTPLRPFKPRKRCTDDDEQDEHDHSTTEETEETRDDVKAKEGDESGSDSDGFENVEDYYEGPEMLTAEKEGLRVMLVREEEILHKHVSGDAVPNSMQEALDLFKKGDSESQHRAFGCKN